MTGNLILIFCNLKKVKNRMKFWINEESVLRFFFSEAIDILLESSTVIFADSILTFSGFAVSLENCTAVSTSLSVLSSSVAFLSLTLNSAAAEKEKLSD